MQGWNKTNIKTFINATLVPLPDYINKPIMTQILITSASKAFGRNNTAKVLSQILNNSNSESVNNLVNMFASGPYTKLN